MEFDDHDEEEEIELSQPPPPVSGSYDEGSQPRSRLKMLIPSDSQAIVRKQPVSMYKECLKNHAVNMGGHAIDGCGEFMPAGEEGSLDALKCAACNCHRNFHRKETDGEALPPQFSPYYRTGPPPLPGYLHLSPRPAPPMALPANSREDQEEDVVNPGGMVKKRFRTKFTQEQKDKMLAFAEKVGWRIQKHDEAAVQQFCMETCIKRQVLKVWMHNNKHTLAQPVIETALPR